MIANRKLTKRGTVICLALFGLVLGCADRVVHTQVPHKIKSQLPKAMSINACADQLLLALADPEQIVSLSYYASDKLSSAKAEQAELFPRNYMSAEEVLAADPDILFSSSFEKPAINKVTKALNIRTYYFGVPANTQEAMKLVSSAGEALMQEDRAKKLNEEILEAIEPVNAKPISAIIYFQGGYSAGANTLIDEIMTGAGFYNMARDFGVGNWGRIDIEQIIDNPPELLIIADTFSNGALQERSLRHKSLYHRGLGIKFAHFPNHYSYCGGPVTIDMAKHLKRIRSEYGKT